ncbi:hypothetical protein [Candidatus Methanomassiliicoccus intestinalis]|uniref:hypothetical protein n=1 Tax=Candidatus Methanomassiliicoccus intestinalis TaxID=1406512 RepID=UPI0037DDA866
MSQNLKNRTYKLSTQTCKQIDYIHFLTENPKPKIIEDAVDLLFMTYAVFPKEMKDVFGSDLEVDSKYLLTKILEDLQKQITESFQKKTL